MNSQNEETTEQKVKSGPTKSAKVILIFILVAIGIYLWFIAIPVVTIWYLFIKNKKLSQRNKLIITGAVIIICGSLYGSQAYANRAPTLFIASPENNAEFQLNDTEIKGSIKPSDAKLTINGLPVEVVNGNFNYKALLKNEQNSFDIIVKNSGKTVQQSLNLKRVFTAEEITTREQVKAEQEKQAKAQADAVKAKKEAELATYYATPAGKICKLHPEWTKDDCQRLADKKIWIGMDITMLKYLRGVPDSANPSNYGNGVQWQWCWQDYTPSCFYGGDDGIVDSYN